MRFTDSVAPLQLLQQFRRRIGPIAPYDPPIGISDRALEKRAYLLRDGKAMNGQCPAFPWKVHLGFHGRSMVHVRRGDRECLSCPRSVEAPLLHQQSPSRPSRGLSQERTPTHPHRVKRPATWRRSRPLTAGDRHQRPRLDRPCRPLRSGRNLPLPFGYAR